MKNQLGGELKNVSISQATLKTEDVFANIVMMFAEDETVQAIANMAAEGEEDLDYLCWELLFDHLNNLAPEGYYFGAHPGDGADFGFWSLGESEEEMKKERDMRAIKTLVDAILTLVDAILKGELSYCQATGSTAYVVEENGKQEIVYNALARPIVASAKWEDRLGNPQWTIYDDDGEAVAAVATEIDGTVDPDVYYY